jgi:hypothetical protein
MKSAASRVRSVTWSAALGSWKADTSAALTTSKVSSVLWSVTSWEPPTETAPV